MNQVEIFLGTKAEFPEEYVEPFLSLWQRNHKEEYPFPPPSNEYYCNHWNIPSESYKQILLGLILNKDKKAVGYIYVSWNTKYDNLDQGFFYIYISVEWDSEEIRKQALKVILSKFPPQITKISSWSELGQIDEVFLRSLKDEQDYQEVFSICYIEELDVEYIKKEAELHRKRIKENGYELKYVDNAKFFESFDKDEICAVFQSIWNDMPRQGLTYEDEIVKPERIEEDIRLGNLRGEQYLSYFVIHEETGKPVSYTSSEINKFQPWVVWQLDTGVIHEYRGKGLGIAVKYQMLERLLQEKNVKYWITGSNVNNVYMREINKTLGYRELKNGYEFEFSREELEERIFK